MSKDGFILKGRLKGRHKLKLAGLMDLDYKPSELAEELEISSSRIYNVYLKLDCPHYRTDRDRIFINGKQFREWYDQIYKNRSLEKDQTFCVSCKKIVKLDNPTRVDKGRLVLYQSDCPNCGKRTSKIVDHKKRVND